MSTRLTNHQLWILVLASIGAFMISMDSLIVTTALTTIRRDLGASIAAAEWTANAYNLTFAVLLVTGAALGDRFGRRRAFAVGLGLFATASAACALSPGIDWLIAARAVQGAGGALVLPQALTLISAAFPPERRGRALGAFVGVVGLGSVLGPLVGGAVVQGLAWQGIFWINVPIGAVAVVLTRWRIPESRGPGGRLDVGGLLLATGGALGLVWAVAQEPHAGWGSAEVVVPMAAGVVLVAAFVSWELRARAPMLPMRLFRLRAFAAGNAAQVCLFASQFGALFLLPQFFQVVLGFGPLAAGLGLVPWSAMLTVGSPVAGALADRVGERALLVGGLVAQTVGMAWLAAIARPDVPYVALLAPLLVSGIGLAVAMPAAQRAVMGGVQPADLGRASGANSTLRWLGAVFGIAVLGTVFANGGSPASPAAFAAGFTPAMGVGAVLALAAVLVGLAVPGRRPAARAAAEAA